MTWKIDNDRVSQLGGKGSDYGAWLNDRERNLHIFVQLGQCGNEPEGDPIARARVQAMCDGLNSGNQ